MVAFGQNWFNSCKVVLIGQNGSIRAKVVGKSGTILAKVIVFEQMWLYSGQVFVFGQK